MRFSTSLQAVTTEETDMDTPYYVASLRGNGWFSKSSQFNTDISEAKEFTYLDALALCKRYKSNGHILVPVRKSDMGRI